MAYLEPGNIMTESEAADYLRNTAKFQKAYNSVLRNFDQSYENLIRNYNRDVISVENAFDSTNKNLHSNYLSNRGIIGANLQQNMENAFQNSLNLRSNFMLNDVGSGFRDQGISDLERATVAAYDSYVKNYMSQKVSTDNQLSQDLTTSKENKISALQTLLNNKNSNYQTLVKNASDVRSQIDKELYNEASNYSSIYNAPREYLQYLVDEGIITHDTEGFEKYFDLTYENGSPNYTFKNSDTLDSIFYEYDENGNIKRLSQKGIDFYNQMFYGTGDLSTSFQDWLYVTDENLYNWTYSTSPYSLGTNFEDVFNQTDDRFKDILSKGNYDKPINTYDDINEPIKHVRNEYMGSVTSYVTSNGNIVNEMSDFKLSGANFGDIEQDEAENFTAVYTDANGNKHKYKMHIDKDANVASDDIMNEIGKTLGDNFVDDKLYTYGNTLYLAEVSDGRTRLIEVTITSGNDEFWSVIKNLDNQTEDKPKYLTKPADYEKPEGVKKREGTSKRTSDRQKMTGTKSGKW